MTARPASPSVQDWMPNFCRLPTVFGMMLAAELVVLVIQLAASTQHSDPWRALFLNTCFVQWIVMVSATLLCQLRSRLGHLTLITSMLLSWGTAMAVTLVATVGAHYVQQTLNLQASGDTSLGRLLLANLTICALVSLAALRYVYIQHQWKRNVETNAEAQFRALQARIRPHFLFNSMNTIASLIRSRPNDAEEAVEDLADLFRAALAPARSRGDLDAELELVGRYLKLEQLRLGDRLSVLWEVDSRETAVAVPPLLIQPLVENAVYHGIQQLPTGGQITVAVATLRNSVEIKIGNPTPEVTPEGGHRIALDNVRQRLDHLYGNAASLKVDQAPTYYQVTLTIPRTPAPGDEAAHRPMEQSA